MKNIRTPRVAGAGCCAVSAAPALRWGLGSLLALLCLTSAQAHLMVAQKGTLNIVGDGAFMVLSLPVTAFPGADDDGDGRLSQKELRAHAPEIEARVLAQVRLADSQGPRPLQGLLLDLSPSDDAPKAPASQLVVLGRFDLAGSQGPLVMTMNLFGTAAGERAHTVTVTRKPEVQQLDFEPGQASRAVLPSAWMAWADQLRSGAGLAVGLAGLLSLLAAAWLWRMRQPAPRSWRLRWGAMQR